ncbi:hypothetical protein VXN63_02310 [Marinilactibacillus sp. XAAS-LB27]|nr:hypothetical protein [Marinilactibacillus sp. XAAS-LB27]
MDSTKKLLSSNLAVKGKLKIINSSISQLRKEGNDGTDVNFSL